MENIPTISQINFSNVLYIGDEAQTCLRIIKRFNARLDELEQKYLHWFKRRKVANRPTTFDRLRYHILYHFEGGIAIFKFKDSDQLPGYIRRECYDACRIVVAEQWFCAS